MSTYLFLSVIQQIGISLAIGSSTFALIFYYKSIRDGTIDNTEKMFLHTVYAVLRIGMAIIILSELLITVWFYYIGETATLITSSYWFGWLIVGIIILNATLMQAHKMPMWLGPAVAGGSWYTYAIVHTLAPVNAPLYVWGLFYILFIMLFAGFLHVVKLVYIDRYQEALKRASDGL